MTRYKCPRCKGNQYSASPDKAHEPCIYCGHEGTVPMKSLEEEGNDLYDMASYALTDCRGCKRPDHKNCEKYKLFMDLNIPVAQEQTDGCPYEN